MASDEESPMLHPADSPKEHNPEEADAEEDMNMDTSADNDGRSNGENEGDRQEEADAGGDGDGSGNDRQEEADGDANASDQENAEDDDDSDSSESSESDVDPIAMEDKEDEDPNFSEADIASDENVDDGDHLDVGRPETPDPPNVIRTKSPSEEIDNANETKREKLKSEMGSNSSNGVGTSAKISGGDDGDQKPNAPGWPLPNPKGWDFPQPGLPSCAMLPWTIRRDLIKFLMKKTDAEPFVDPVDTATFKDYLKIIKYPICLKDILKKTQARKEGYTGDEFDHDLRMMFANAHTYSDPNSSYIWDTIKRLRGFLDSRIYKERKKVEISKRRPRTRTRKKQESDLQNSLHRATKRRKATQGGGGSGSGVNSPRKRGGGSSGSGGSGSSSGSSGGRKPAKRRRLQGDVESSPPVIEGHVESRPSSPSHEQQQRQGDAAGSGSRSPTMNGSGGRPRATSGSGRSTSSSRGAQQRQMFDQRIDGRSGSGDGARRPHPMAAANSSGTLGSGGSSARADDGRFGLASLFEHNRPSGSTGSGNNSGRSSPSYADDMASRGPSLATALMRRTQKAAAASQGSRGTLSGSIRHAHDRRGSHSPHRMNGFGALTSDIMASIRPPSAGEVSSSKSPPKRRRLSDDAALASLNGRRPFETGPPPLERDDSLHSAPGGSSQERRSSSSHNSRSGPGNSRAGRGGSATSSSSKKGSDSSKPSSSSTGRKTKKNVVPPGKPKGRPRKRPTKKSAPSRDASSGSASGSTRFSGTVMDDSSFSPTMNGMSDDPRRRRATPSPSTSALDGGAIPSLSSGMMNPSDRMMNTGLYSSLSESEQRSLQQQHMRYQRQRANGGGSGSASSRRAPSLENGSSASSPNSHPGAAAGGGSGNYSHHSQQQQRNSRHSGSNTPRQQQQQQQQQLSAQQRAHLLCSQEAAAAHARRGGAGSVIDISSPSGGQDFPHPMSNRGGRPSFSSNGSPTEIAAQRQQMQQQHANASGSGASGPSSSSSSSSSSRNGAHPGTNLPPGLREPRPGMTSQVPVPDNVRRMITARSAELHKRMKAASNEVCDIFSDYLRLETQYKFVCYERDMILRENLSLQERHNDAKKEMQRENNNLLHTASEFKRENAHLKELVADLKKQLAASAAAQANGQAQQANLALAQRLENELRLSRANLARQMASTREEKKLVHESRDTIKRLRLQVQQYKEREETLRARVKATLS